VLADDRTGDGSQESALEFSAVYRDARGRSTSFLVDPNMIKPSRAQSMADCDESIAPLTPMLPHFPPLNVSTWHEVLFIGTVIMAQFIGLAGLGQSIAPMHIVAEGLHVTNPGEQAWFAAAFSLTVGTFILISGRMGDILGHKRVFIFGYFFLGCWSGFAGFSAYVENQIFFDVCRAFQGIGAALLAPNALALLGRAYPPGIKKNIVFSLFGAMAPWGFVMGALFASIFAELLWWPWAYWSYAIAAWALSAFSMIIIPKVLAHDAQFADNITKPGMDWKGSILGVSGLILVNVAWNNGPLFGWGEPHVYFILIIGILMLVGFAWVETRAISPILPVKVMSSAVTYTMILVGIGWGSFGIWIFYAWRFLEEIREYTPLQVSAQYTPALICGLLAAGVTGFMLTHTPVAFTMFISMVAFFIGQLITATQPASQTYWGQMFFAILIMPFGKWMLPCSMIHFS
jgi:MFS family permease